MRLGKKNRMKLEYVFSDPECPLIFSVCGGLNAFKIILKGRQSTFKLDF